MNRENRKYFHLISIIIHQTDNDVSKSSFFNTFVIKCANSVRPYEQMFSYTLLTHRVKFHFRKLFYYTFLHQIKTTVITFSIKFYLILFGFFLAKL